ncbi:MAG: hypothetical protein KMY54_06820 [Erysipelothrix sp.]|nr:hypothetical protein [Erysipelothrix sp.]
MAISMQDVRSFKSSRNRVALLGALYDMDPKIRQAAVIALIELADPRDVDSVKQYLLVEYDLHILGKVLPIVQQAKLYDEPEFLDKLMLRIFNVSKVADQNSGNVSSSKRPETSVDNDQISHKANLIKVKRLFGGFLIVLSLVLLSTSISSSADIRWVYILLALLSGAMAIVIFSRGKSPKNADVTVIKKELPPMESDEVNKDHFTRLFHPRDIFAMAILYEGKIPDNKAVTPSMIAREVVTALHQENKYIDDRLSFHAVIKMQRVEDYKFFGSEDYNPGSDLDDLLRSCMDEVRQMVITDDPLIEKVAAQMSRVKVRTSTLGVVWVGMYISMI